MSILEEAMQKPKVEDFSTQNEDPAGVLTVDSGPKIDFWEIIKTPTGPGSLDEYKESPLNFNKSEGLARILRGLAGFIGADILRSAVVDILFGFLQFVRGRVESA